MSKKRKRVLLLTGTREAGTFPLPPGVDCVTLPAYRKGLGGLYSARSLLRETASLTGLRVQLIDTASTASPPMSSSSTTCRAVP